MDTPQERTLSVHQEHFLLRQLEAAGLTGELTQRVLDSKYNQLAFDVVELIRIGGFRPAT